MSGAIRNLNIAMVAACPFPTSQGSQVLIRELSEALSRRGHRVHVVTYHFGEPLECPGLIIHRIPELFRYNKFRSGPEIRKPILDLLLMRKLDQVVRREGIDIVHAHNYEAPLAALPVCRRHRIPLVYHSHNTMSDEFYTYFRLKIPQKLARAAARFMDRYIPRQADFIIAINPQVAAFLTGMGTPATKIKYIPPGIDYGEVPRPDPAILKKCGIRDEKLILYAGNLDGYQRIDLLLEALAQVFKAHEDARFVLMTGSDTTGFVRDVERLALSDRITVVPGPSYERVKALLAHGRVAVNSRISWSGFPIKLLNYMAAGLPVVAFRGAAAPVVDGQTGILAPPGNIKAFAAAINVLLSDQDLSRRLGSEAKRMAMEQFTWKVIAGGVERIYHRLLGIRLLDSLPEVSRNKGRELPKFEYSA
ncbi:MAG TPA: glycosyltransferase family 4 protein [bacterium]